MTDDRLYDPYARLDPVSSFGLVSDDIADGEALGVAQYGVDAGGSEVSPHLDWFGAPDDTKSYAVTVFDPDAPTGSGFWHWAVYNIPAEVTELGRGAGSPGTAAAGADEHSTDEHSTDEHSTAALPAGAQTLPNELRLRQYTGAAPPPGTGEHRYFFVVHALDVERLDLDPESTPAVLGFNLHFHTLARAVLVATGSTL